MKICILGGGHVGHVIAGFLSSRKDVEVRVLTRRPNLWTDRIIVRDLAGQIFDGTLAMVTSDPAKALADVDIALLSLPGFSIREELISIKDHLEKKTAVGSVVSSTGFFFQAFEILGKDQPLFGFQRVPFISRIKVYGRSAELLGYKSSLSIAVEQCNNPEKLRRELEKLFAVPVMLMENHYEVSLTNSNPILHTSRLYSLWKDYKEGETYPGCYQFYADWNTEASEILIEMDKEFHTLLKSLPVRPGAIPTILEYYESTNAETLAAKLRSIAAFRGLRAPMVEVGGRWVPDFKSRYFTEDFPYGLKFIYDLAREKGISTPTIDKVYNWGLKWVK